MPTYAQVPVLISFRYAIGDFSQPYRIPVPILQFRKHRDRGNITSRSAEIHSPVWVTPKLLLFPLYRTPSLEITPTWTSFLSVQVFRSSLEKWICRFLSSEQFVWVSHRFAWRGSCGPERSLLHLADRDSLARSLPFRDQRIGIVSDII